MKQITSIILTLLMMVSSFVSCVDTEGLETQIENLEDRIAALESTVGEVNGNAVAIKKFYQENTIIVGLTELEHGYELQLSDGTVIKVTDGINAPGIVPIVGLDEKGNWLMSIDGGETFNVIKGATNAFSESGQTPQVKVDAEGFWLVSIDGGTTFTRILDANGNPISAIDGMLTGGISTFFTDVKYDEAKGILTIVLKTGESLEIPVVETFFLNIKDHTAGATIFLNQTLTYKVEASDVAKAMIQAPDGWHAVLTDAEFTVTGPAEGNAGEYDINIVIVSSDGFIKHVKLTFTLNPQDFNSADCKLFNDFLAGNEENVLLDFSYAGYDHGETAPLEASALGYKVFDVTEYGAIANDGKSDRAAFLACVEAATGQKFSESNKVLTLGHKEKANAIIYFPEGEFILHTSEDDFKANDGKTYSRTIQIRAGNIVLRGAGRDKTILVMQDKNLPTDEKTLYSSPLMIDFKHNSGLGSNDNGVTIDTPVTKNADKGTFAVEVGSTAGLSEGRWVCLSVQNNDPNYVAKELEAGAPTADELARMTDIVNNGVKVYEYHQIKKVEGNVVTFYEPIHHEVDIQYTAFTDATKHYNWKLLSFPHYENVGIEDLTFKGDAKDKFVHHGSWEDDGAFKPLGMTRLVNSWLRRVRFTSVSEACSVTNCSNVSVYDIHFNGRRGHSSIRSQVSTRVFIGATIDEANGYLIDSPSVFQEKAGQYHAVGVSKPSMGTVLWRNVWGSDACFESHATQPRATLIDCCRGGWMKSRQGGDENQVPNHLADLTVWNFESLTSQANFNWWDHESKWWKFLPPVVAGFHGQSVTFDESQMKVNFSNGMPVNPESLYEAQLKNRLGAVPAWLNSLK